MRIIGPPRQDPATVERLLRSLPDWFGIEPAIDSYIDDARTMPTYLALASGGGTGEHGGPGDRGEPGRGPIGALLVARHFPGAAEIHLMAVAPEHHRSGVGRALVAALERDLAADGVSLLQVKTLGPSRPNAAYERTRAFYVAMGFQPLEEIHDLWPGNPCLIMVKPLAAAARQAGRPGAA